MAITWIDGFDLYSATVPLSTRYTLVNTPSLVTGRFGGQALSVNNAAASWGIPITSTLAFGAALKITSVTSLGSGQKLVSFRNNANGDQVVIQGTNTGTLIATNGAGTVLGTSAAGLFAEGAWHYLEAEITRNATTGAITVYMDGAAVITATSVNTGGFDIDTLTFPNINDGSTRVWDDLYLCNVATRKGESRVAVMAPAADTATIQWTPNSGTVHFNRVNEATFDGDTTYNFASAVGNTDLYTVTALPFTPTSIRAAQTVMCARKDDATTRQLATQLVSGTTTATGATATMTTSYTITYNIYETDPNTSAAWTPTNLNAVNLGAKVIT